MLAATHGPPAKRKAGGSYHRFSQIIRHSLRDGLRLIARSPWEPGFLAPIASRSFCPLDTSVGVPGPHALTVRLGTVRPRKIARVAKASIASCLACRDDRDTPLMPKQDGRDNAPDLGSTSSNILKIRMAPIPRQIDTTGKFRMTLMHRLPVVQVRIEAWAKAHLRRAHHLTAIAAFDVGTPSAAQVRARWLCPPYSATTLRGAIARRAIATDTRWSPCRSPPTSPGRPARSSSWSS